VLGVGDRELLEAIGYEVAQALERAVLFEAERDARLRAELMERNAAHLAAASTALDVARATVEDLEAFGADVVFVWRLRDQATLEALASTDVPQGTHERFDTYPINMPGLVTDALERGELAAVGTADEFDRIHPNLAEERARLGFESMVAAPLRDASGDVVGVLFAASRTRHWLNTDRRQLLLGVAEQTGVALERAMLFETEREARRLAQLLEQNAAHLAAAVTLEDVAESTVSDLEHAGFAFSVVQVLGVEDIEVLAAAGLPGDVVNEHRATALDARSPSAEVIRTGQVVEIGAGSDLDRRYPDFADVRRRLGLNTALAVPLRAADRRVIGVLGVSATEERWLTHGRRQVIFGVAEQCGLALERAQLYAQAVAKAAEAAFVAHFVDVLERSTTVSARVRRLTELLTEERATFAAVHLVDEGQPRLVAVSGSRPVEAADDERWSQYVEEAVSEGHPVHPEDGATNGPGSHSSMVILPLRARGHVIGALTIRTALDSRWEPAISPAFAREIASRAAVRIDNALLYERERDVSHSLQLGLLGGTLPTFEGVVITAAYRAGTEALEVGGDWYDAFLLPSGSIALIVGDVVGHGLEAAVAMGQLRGAVSALAQTASPATLLNGLDAFVENVPSAATATLAYVELDPTTGRMTYACAGHPPPLVVSADGQTRYLWDGRSAPLGSMLGYERSEAVDHLEEAETIVLYTDGLVERRAESLDVGFERLATSSTLHAPAGHALADDISDDLLRGQVQGDDVCVLTLHRLPVAARTFGYSFPASPAELAGLRESLRAWLEEHAIDVETTRSTVLAVSEAAANAVEHGYRCDGVGIVSVEARVDDDQRLEISVRDTGAWREAGPNGDRGRGIPIIEAIVDELTIRREDGATVVRMLRRATDEVAA
jgi:serine/threonine-protein kinase RsbW